jgi:hypothetical protein
LSWRELKIEDEDDEEDDDDEDDDEAQKKRASTRPRLRTSYFVSRPLLRPRNEQVDQANV